MKWLPIKTAPEDETRVQLGWWEHTERHDGLQWVIVVGDTIDIGKHVTHWKPLPDPPEAT